VVQSFVDGVHVFPMSIENRYAPPLRNIEVTKIWKDEVGPLRPDVITLLGRRLGMICSADQQASL